MLHIHKTATGRVLCIGSQGFHSIWLETNLLFHAILYFCDNFLCIGLFLRHFVMWRDIDQNKMLPLIWVQGVLISSKLAAAWHLEVLFIFKQFRNSWSEISSKIASFYDNQQLSSSEYALWFFSPFAIYVNKKIPRIFSYPVFFNLLVNNDINFCFFRWCSFLLQVGILCKTLFNWCSHQFNLSLEIPQSLWNFLFIFISFVLF